MEEQLDIDFGGATKNKSMNKDPHFRGGLGDDLDANLKSGDQRDESNQYVITLKESDDDENLLSNSKNKNQKEGETNTFGSAPNKHPSKFFGRQMTKFGGGGSSFKNQLGVLGSEIYDSMEKRISDLEKVIYIFGIGKEE